jgi:hypothetical protein
VTDHLPPWAISLSPGEWPHSRASGVHPRASCPVHRTPKAAMSLLARSLSFVLATAEVLFRLAGISAYLTTDGAAIEQGGRTWREIGRSEPNACGERAFWAFGLYMLAVNTKASTRHFTEQRRLNPPSWLVA